MSNRRIGESTAKPLDDDLRSPRFPPPPRTPSIGAGLRKPSGAQPRMDPSAAASAEETPHRSGTSPVHAEFRAEEAPSFDKRLTPVVAASWPEQEATTAAYKAIPTTGAAGSPSTDATQGPTGPLLDAGAGGAAQPTGGPALEPAGGQPAQTTGGSPSTRPAQDVAAAPTSQRSVSISLSPSGGEHAFWDGDPQYSVAPARLVSEPPLPKPSRARWALTRLLFVAIVGLVLGLLYFEAAMAYHVPWRNPQLLLERIRIG